VKSVKILSEELEVSKQTIFNNIKRLNIETIKKENTSFIKEDADVERIIQRVNKNKKKYGFESNTTDRKTNESNRVDVKTKSDSQIIEILKNQIDTLNSQIEKQESRHETTIKFYRKELQERSKLLENQQILALESNKKIQKLENQLEKERQFNYPLNMSTNDKQKVSSEEIAFTEESKDSNQQQNDEQSTEVQHKDVDEKEKGNNIIEDKLTKEDKFFEETKNSNDDNREMKSPKKGFWSRLFGN
jgi:replication-associated protein